MQHLDEGTIHAFLDGALAGDEAATVAAHVSECRDCAAMVAEARGIIAAAGNIVSALDGVRGGVIPAPARAAAGQHSLWRRLRFTPARAALAATLLIAVASLLTVRHAPAPVATESSVRPVPAPTGAAGVAGAPVRPAEVATASPREPAHRKVENIAAVPPSATNVEAPTTDSGTRAAKVAVNARSQTQPRAIAGAQRPSVDSLANTVADQAFARGAAPQPRAQSAMQLREVTGATSLAAKSLALSTGLDGCYQLRPDSASSALSAGFPSRFALVKAGDGSLYVVRFVSPEGRIDSIVPGSSWQRLTPEVVRVSFTNAADQRSLTLQLATGVADRATVGNQIGTLPITRIECRR
ncbi:MAG TPA: zf-HC2 domain-containing protein [Gemmatimonadaceae bacterium]